DCYDRSLLRLVLGAVWQQDAAGRLRLRFKSANHHTITQRLHVHARSPCLHHSRSKRILEERLASSNSHARSTAAAHPSKEQEFVTLNRKQPGDGFPATSGTGGRIACRNGSHVSLHFATEMVGLCGHGGT